MPVYTGQEEVINDTELYEDLINKRERKEILQKERFYFNREFMRGTYNIKRHTWSQGDKLFKISARYYGDTKYWWLIALWNDKPTDADYRYGDVIEIPSPIVQLYREVTNGVY